MSQNAIKSEAEGIAKEKARELEKSMNIVKEIFTIIMALAFTNTVIQFFVDPSASGTYAGKDVSSFSYINWWIFFSIIITIMRFYHGNALHLNKRYNLNDLVRTGVYGLKNKYSTVPPFLDSFFIIFEGFLFALMSIYQFNFSYLFWLFVLLLSCDFVLFFLLGFIRILDARSISKARLGLSMSILLEETETRWLVVNTGTVVALFGCYLIIRDSLFAANLWIFLVIIMCNSILDYVLNWKYYFPLIPEGS